MLKFKSLGFGLAILIALIFTGCGDSSSSPSNDDDTTEIDTGIIDSSYLYSTKFTEASEIATKSDYETIADHELRVNKYIEEQDIIYFDVGIYDSYDSETKVLSLYGFTDYNSSKHSFSMGMWNFQYIDVYNFNLFPITVKILSAESDDLFPTERSVFHEYTIESDIAYDLKARSDTLFTPYSLLAP